MVHLLLSADAALIAGEPVAAQMLDPATSRATVVGHASIDVDAATARRTVVCNTPDAD